jgi:hypothetical protein
MVYDLVVMSLVALVCMLLALWYEQTLFATVFAAQFAFAAVAAIRRARKPNR